MSEFLSERSTILNSCEHGGRFDLQRSVSYSGLKKHSCSGECETDGFDLSGFSTCSQSVFNGSGGSAKSAIEHSHASSNSHSLHSCTPSTVVGGPLSDWLLRPGRIGHRMRRCASASLSWAGHLHRTEKLPGACERDAAEREREDIAVPDSSTVRPHEMRDDVSTARKTAGASGVACITGYPTRLHRVDESPGPARWRAQS